MKRIVFGVLVIAAGIFLLLNNLDFFHPAVYNIVISWPALFIAIGIVLFVDKPSDHKIAGIVLILAGSLFLFPKIFTEFNFSKFILPITIIAVGAVFVVKSITRKIEINYFGTWNGNNLELKTHFKNFEKNVTTSNGGIVRKEYVFTGSKEKWTQGKLRKVEVEAAFSGVELDFSLAELADDLKVAAHIKVTSVFSGVTLYLPDDWNIMIQKTGVFGSFSDNRPSRALQVSGDKLVILELEAVFGGGEIRCYE